jgi:hypothetical protein
VTTIVYRDGVLAADSRAYAGNRSPIGFKQKIRAIVVDEVPYLVGVSTPVPGYGEAVLNWFEAGHNFHDSPPMPEGGFTLLAVDAAGQAYYANDTFYLSGPLDAPFWAIGSGEEYAIGALTSGASAFEAVKVAMTYDQWTGGPIHTLRFETSDDQVSVSHIIHEPE